jgi:hypothetical protein
MVVMMLIQKFFKGLIDTRFLTDDDHGCEIALQGRNEFFEVIDDNGATVQPLILTFDAKKYKGESDFDFDPDRMVDVRDDSNYDKDYLKSLEDNCFARYADFFAKNFWELEDYLEERREKAAKREEAKKLREEKLAKIKAKRDQKEDPKKGKRKKKTTKVDEENLDGEAPDAPEDNFQDFLDTEEVNDDKEEK